MAKGGWYDSKSKGKGKSEKKEAKEPETMHERHANERMEAHKRHAGARDDMHKQHEEELAQMAERQATEAQTPPADGGEPQVAATGGAAGPAPGTMAPGAQAA